MDPLIWIDPLPDEFTSTATVAVARPTGSLNYRINLFGEKYILVRLDKAGEGSINHLIAEELVSIEEAQGKAQADYDSNPGA